MKDYFESSEFLSLICGLRRDLNHSGAFVVSQNCDQLGVSWSVVFSGSGNLFGVTSSKDWPDRRDLGCLKRE